MIISAKVIKKPRAKRFCVFCNKVIGGPQLRLYGNGCSTDPPYTIYIHLDCTKNKDLKIKNAIKKYTKGTNGYEKKI